MNIPDQDGSLRLWDFVAGPSRLYFLLSGAGGHAEYAETDFAGRVLNRIPLPADTRFHSGRIVRSRAGRIAILRRSLHGPSDVLIDNVNGMPFDHIGTGQPILEIAFSGDRLIGTTWNALFVITGKTQPSGKTPLVTFQPELMYPFALLALPNETVATLEYPQGLVRYIDLDKATATAPATLSESARNERPQELANDAAVIDTATVNESGGLYCGLPNFTASDYSRILVVDSNGNEAILTFPLAMRGTNSTQHAYPVSIRVSGTDVFVASLRLRRIAWYSF